MKHCIWVWALQSNMHTNNKNMGHMHLCWDSGVQWWSALL
jgi:hypothetical protein